MPDRRCKPSGAGTSAPNTAVAASHSSARYRDDVVLARDVPLPVDLYIQLAVGRFPRFAALAVCRRDAGSRSSVTIARRPER
jgi:hypothetical protein